MIYIVEVHLLTSQIKDFGFLKITETISKQWTNNGMHAPQTLWIWRNRKLEDNALVTLTFALTRLLLRPESPGDPWNLSLRTWRFWRGHSWCCVRRGAWRVAAWYPQLPLHCYHHHHAGPVSQTHFRLSWLKTCGSRFQTEINHQISDSNSFLKQILCGFKYWLMGIINMWVRNHFKPNKNHKAHSAG